MFLGGGCRLAETLLANTPWAPSTVAPGEALGLDSAFDLSGL